MHVGARARECSNARQRCLTSRNAFGSGPALKWSSPAIDPADTSGFKSKQEANGRLAKKIERLYELQYRLAAENRRSLLVILQAMDAGGKDGTIRHVMTGLNPQGCRVTSFKVPAGEEARTTTCGGSTAPLPAFGEIGIFNRSHYEDVLVVRVHDLVPKAVWSRRYEQINEFEQDAATTTAPRS